MKRSLLLAALFAAFPAFAQTSAPGPVAPATSTATPPGMGTPVPSVGVVSPVPGTGTVAQQPGTGVITTTPGTPNVSTVGGPSSSATGSTIPSQPLPPDPSPREPSTLGGTGIQPTR